jgi:tRNA(Leu) C34 or U34 (ribose-2'-O)-methylase TrmL
VQACRPSHGDGLRASAARAAADAPGQRSLNLSNAVAVAVFEAWRQNGFGGAC